MVSVIIVNYNGIDVVQDCLHALESQTFKDFEIIIVDNCSTDGSLERLNQYSNKSPPSLLIKVISLSKNMGFSGGNSEGLKHANGNFIALLNNDTEPESRWLEELVKKISSNPEIGVYASRLIVYNSEIIDSAGDGFSKALKGFKMGEGSSFASFNKDEYVFGACAGAAMYRRKMLEEIGFFDENFFLIYEDTDLNFRAQLAGWKVLYVPTAIVHHKVRSSIGIMSDTAVYYSLRNSELVRIKNVPFFIFLRCLPEFIVSFIVEFIYFAVKNKKISLYFKAKKDALSLLPLMLEKRKAIMKKRKVSDKYLLSIMTPVWQKDFFKAKTKKFFHG
jgi:hypothetical protein